MFSLSVSKALATRESQARLGSKRPHLQRYLPGTEVLEGRQLLTTGIDSVLPGGAGRTVALAAFEAGQAGSRTWTWTPISTELRVDQGQTAQIVAARVTTNLAVGTATATIDWGDGVTSSTQAAVYAIDYDPTGAGLDPWGIRVAGEHTYLTPGTFNVRTTITTAGGESTTVTNKVVVTPSLSLSGALDPTSDTGSSNVDGITATTQPRFQGNATPNVLVQLFATRQDGGTPFPIGQGVADAQGRWSVTSLPLAEGAYQITARATSADGRVLPPVAIAVGNAGGPLVVDTTGPRVVGLTLNPLNAQIQVSFGDNLSGLAGLGTLSSNGASLQRLVRSRATTIPTWPLSVSNDGRSVLLGLSRPLGNGRYTFRINAAGVRDVAGNALDGEYTGSFASGNGKPGGDFGASFQVARRQSTTPRPIQAAVTRPSGRGATRRVLKHTS